MHTKASLLALLFASAAAGGSALVDAQTAPGAYQTYPAQAPAYGAPNVSGALAQWHRLRQSDNLPFGEYASFLLNNRGWPGETALRRSAEAAIAPGLTPPSEVLRFFSGSEPQTGTGHLRRAEALLATGRTLEAQAAARTAWIEGGLRAEDEARARAQFESSLRPEDHDARLERLLAERQVAAAQRVLPYASPARRGLYEARVALLSKAPMATTNVALLGSAAASDPGLLMDHARYLRETMQPIAARALLAQPVTFARLPARPEKWMEGLLTVAREAANDGQWQLAYDIARKGSQAYAAGTDVSETSAGERDEYTSLAWLAGNAALKLGRANDAVAQFDAYARAAKSGQTKSKGYFWAGRAAERVDRARADAYYADAARYFDQFYGQLALEKLGRPLPAPPAAALAAPTAAERAAWNARSIVQAARQLGRTGQWRDQSLFLRAIAQGIENDGERHLAAELAREVGRPDLGVMVARQPRADGTVEYARYGFPELPAPVSSPQLWTLSHAIARQESQFDRMAMSPVGARGLMQLMPATAAEQAGKLGMSYQLDRLTSDPAFNVMLGSSYFAGLLDYWGGNYPLAVASYNAGAGNVRRWITRNGDPRLPYVDTIEWIENIPIFETRNYVQRVLENAVVYDQLNPTRARAGTSGKLSYYLGEPVRRG